MPKFAPEQLGQRQQVPADTQQQYLTQVVARPVSTSVAPAENNLMRLSTALQQFMPAATMYAEKLTQEDADEKKQLGQQAKLRGEPLPPEADPMFKAGYLNMHGTIMAGEIGTDLRAEAEQHRNDPNFNPTQFAQEFIAKQTQGITDPHILKPLNAHLAQEVFRVQSDFEKYHTAEVRSDERNAAFGTATVWAKSLGDNPEAYRNWYDSEFFPQMRSMGIDGPEIANLAVQALIDQAVATKDPRRLEPAQVAGESGRYLAENPELSHRINQARAHIEQLQKQDLAAYANEANKSVAVQWSALTNDPSKSPEELAEFVRENSKGPNAFFGTDDKVKTAFDQVFERREKAIQFQQFAYAERAGMLSGMSNLPGYKEYVAQRRTPYWDAVVSYPQGSAEQDAAITALVDHIQATKVSDPRLDAMLSGMATAMPLVDKATGKETLPPDFKIAYNLYTALNKAGNYNLVKSAMGEDTARLLAIMDDEIRHLGRTDVDALKDAKKAMSPDALRLKSGLTGQHLNDIRADISSLLYGPYDTGHLGEAKNNRQMIDKLVDMAATEYSKGFPSPKSAVEYVIDRFKANHKQVAGYWVKIPDLDEDGKYINQEFVTRGFDDYVERYAKETRVDTNRLLISLQPGEKSYLIGDPMDPQTFRQVDVTELQEKGRELRLVSKPKLATTIDIANGLRQGTLDGKAITENWEHISSMYALGQMNSKTYERVNALRKAYQRQADDAAVKEIQRIAQVISGMADVGDPYKDNLIVDLTRPIPQPGGRNKDTYSYVKQYAKDDPTSALTMMNEGLRLSRYMDPNGKDFDIGFGYNLTSRRPDVVKKDLARAGVAPHLITQVMDGKAEITPQQAVRLFQNARTDYETMAEKALGTETWKILPKNLKAVFTDLAYATGDPSQFKEAVSAVKSGNYQWLGDNLKISYKPQGSDKAVPDWRRIGLLRAMAKGEDSFLAYVDLAHKSYNAKK